MITRSYRRRPMDGLYGLDVGSGAGDSRSRYPLILFGLLREWNDHRLKWTFTGIPGLTEAVVAGADFFQRCKITLDPEREALILDSGALRLTLIALRIRTR